MFRNLGLDYETLSNKQVSVAKTQLKQKKAESCTAFVNIRT